MARAVAAQRRPPDRWIVVDDGSTDDTLRLLRGLEREIAFLEVLEAPQKPSHALDDRLALALEALAFNFALERAGDGFDYVGKLDGDVELPPDHFERLLARMRANPRLGIAGCVLEEPSGGRWVRVRIPEHHVHGAVKLYRAACFDAIGGIAERLGWDVVDEALARMHGYETLTFRDMVARHHRPSGSAAGQIRGRARAGLVAYIVRYPLWWVVPRAAKVATTRPYGLSGAAFLLGYLRAAIRRERRLGGERYEAFVREELSARVRGRFGTAPLSGSEPASR